MPRWSRSEATTTTGAPARWAPPSGSASAAATRDSSSCPIIIIQWRCDVSPEWRVACVRIPRFPIGAVWRAVPAAPVAPSLQLDAWPPQTTLDERALDERVLDDRPLALSDTRVSPPRLRTVSRAASRRDV